MNMCLALINLKNGVVSLNNNMSGDKQAGGSNQNHQVEPAHFLQLEKTIHSGGFTDSEN